MDSERYSEDVIQEHLCRLRQCSDPMDQELFRVMEMLSLRPKTPRSESVDRFPYEVRGVGIVLLKKEVTICFDDRRAAEQFYELVRRRYDEYAGR